MKVLVCARHFGYLRNFESALDELARRGHKLHLVADREETSGGRQMVERLAERAHNVSVGWAPTRESDGWVNLATTVRLGQDYLRFLDRRFDRAPKLRQRAKERTAAAIVWLVERAGFRYRPARSALDALFRLVEQAIPRSPAQDAFIREQAPDVVLLTPLIDLGSPQLDLLKSAKAAGRRTALCVGSWDHLSSKALLRISTDLVTVWNSLQRREAIDLHGVPHARVVVTGAQCYDQWFDRRPDRSREEFCRVMGLPKDQPFVLWVCSSLFRGGPPEARLVQRWIKAIRCHPVAALRNAGLLVRPHPGRMGEWNEVDRSDWSGVALHGGNPIDDRSRIDYFDALYHCEAVVGLNTSAFLEAAIVGRPVLAILHPDYWKSQEGTLHFHYLLTAGGGLLRTARNLDTHLGQLFELVGRPRAVKNLNTLFVEEFLRPQGINQPATPLFIDAIEGLVTTPVTAVDRVPLMAHAIRPALQMCIAAGQLRARLPSFRKARKDWRHARKKCLERVRKHVRHGLRRYVERPLEGATRSVVPRTTRPQVYIADRFEDLEVAQATREAVTELSRSRGPIIVGPWLSEAGFELLYWIPFLRWAKTYGNLREDRLIAVSRGGAAPWYRDVAASYCDIFEHLSPDAFRARNVERVATQEGQKHVDVADLDREIVDRVRSAMRLKHVHLLHPSLMYNLFRSFWLQHASLDLIQSFTLQRRLPQVEVDQPRFDRPYVAVKFYANDALPDTPENQRFVSDLLARLTGQYDVVLLNTGIRPDEHSELGKIEPSRVKSIESLITPTNNLAVQTAVVMRAQAFVSTYGGFSYLGPLCGVNTVAFYSDPLGFRFDHLDVATRTFREVNGGAYVTLQSCELGLLDLGLGRADPAHTMH